MPVLTQLDPPGGVKDLASRPALRKRWSDQVSDWFDAAIERIRVRAPKPQFYNPLVTPTDPGSAEKEIAWLGFPQVLLREANGNRRLAYQRADRKVAIGQERNHDEYLEWHVTRDPAGSIIRITFTTEPPEYYDFLARAGDAGTTILLKLYRKYISPDVVLSDLIVNGVYNPLNRWNSRDGAMHLTHHSNSLQAELYLAADGTILRRKGARVLSDAQELIDCAQVRRTAAGLGPPHRRRRQRPRTRGLRHHAQEPGGSHHEGHQHAGLDQAGRNTDRPQLLQGGARAGRQQCASGVRGSSGREIGRSTVQRR